MSTTKFESIIQRYFEKVYVSMLRKSIDYEDLDTLPNYILVDKKRESYYLTESDLNDFSSKSEIVQLSERVSGKVTDDKLANTIARLIYTYANFSLEFTSDNIVFADLSKKASFIISDENMEAIKSVLDNLSIQYVPVFVKAGYIILFIDNDNFNSLIDFFLDDRVTNSPVAQNSLDNDADDGDNTLNIDDNDNNFNLDNDDLDDGNKNSNNDSLNTNDLDNINLDDLNIESSSTDNSGTDTLATNNLGSDSLDNLDLNDLDLDNFSTENVDTDNLGLDDLDLDSLGLDDLSIDATATSATNTTGTTDTIGTNDIVQPPVDDLADDIFGSNDTFNDMTDSSGGLGSTDSIPFNDILNSDLDALDDDDLFEVDDEEAESKTKVVETPIEEPIAKTKKIKTKTIKIKNDNKSYPISTFLAFIFMAPAFILDRITVGKLPPFVIYWFTMLTLFFGIYEIPTSHIVEDYYSILSPMINNNIIQMTDTSAIIVTSISFTQSVEPKTAGELLSNPIISSVGFVASVSTFLYEYQFAELFGNLIILRYCLAFSVMLMITSFLRAFGFKLYCTFMLLFLTIPYIILLQSKILLIISDNLSFLIANPMANPPSGLFMIQSLISMLTVFVLPLLIILIYYGFFAIITPTKPKGVLP